MKTRKIIIAGGGGYLGRSLSPLLLKEGYRVILLTRHPSSNSSEGEVEEVEWDGRTPGRWAGLLEGADAVINLTGRSVNCRYTAKNQQEIINSRVHSVEALAAACALCERPPKVWIQASSLAIYGNTGDEWCAEDRSPGVGFSVKVCLMWEDAFRRVHLPDTRKVVLRIGLAMGLTEGTNNGILGTLIKLVKLGLGGSVGSGRQYVSWIHLDDLNRIFLKMIKDAECEGVYNVAAPQPVTNAELMCELRRALHRPWSPRTPAFLAEVGSWLMRTEASLALTGRRCAPARLQEAGFHFHYPELRPALNEIFPQGVKGEREAV